MDVRTIQNKVNYLLKNTDEQQKQTLRGFVKMPLESRIKVFEEQKKSFYSLREKQKDTPISILLYSSFVIAINQFSANTEDIDKNIMEIRSNSVRKFAKREKLLAKWALIKELKNIKGLSFRQISNYLKKYHKLDVVHSTVYDLWIEIENNEKEGKK